jgi:hypothetical protein
MTASDKLLAVLSQLPSAIAWNSTSETVYRVAMHGLTDDDIKGGYQRILTRSKFRPTPSEVLLAVAVHKYGDAQPYTVIDQIAEGLRCGHKESQLHPTVILVLRKTGGYKAWRVEPPIKGQQLQEAINEVMIVRLTEHMNEQRNKE